jgi:hypothetical protein
VGVSVSLQEEGATTRLVEVEDRFWDKGACEGITLCNVYDASRACLQGPTAYKAHVDKSAR